MACRRRRRDLQGAQRRNSENPFSRHIISFSNCLYGRQAMPLALLWFLLALKARKKNQTSRGALGCWCRRRDLQGAQRRNSENPFSRHIISFPNCLYDRQSNAFGVALVFACFKGKKKTKRAGARLAAGAEGGT